MKVPFDINFLLGTVPKSTEEEGMDETEFIFAYIGIP